MAPLSKSFRGKPIQNYGVWACNIVSYKVQNESTSSRSPHINLVLDDQSGNQPQCAINTKSRDVLDANLIYWFEDNFQHPFTQTLDGLDYGYQAGNQENGLGLDFVRTSPPLIDINSGTELANNNGMGDDILNRLVPIIKRAKEEKAQVFLFGSQWHDPRSTGIHDIHMNQGSDPRFDNSIFTDGCMFAKFDDAHYEAVFLAFATQKLPTDDQGKPASGSTMLSDIVKNKSWSGDGTDGQ